MSDGGRFLGGRAGRRGSRCGSRRRGPWPPRRRRGAPPGGCSGPARRRPRRRTSPSRRCRARPGCRCAPRPPGPGAGVQHRDAVGADAPSVSACRTASSSSAAGLGRDQVGQDLGVGLGGEHGAVARSACARSSSAFSMMPLWTTATGPETCGCALTSLGSPCVAHRVCPMPGLPLNRAGSERGEVGHPALGLVHPDLPAAPQHGHAGRVVPAVLQPGQPFQQDRDAVASPDVRDDSAHAMPPVSRR